MIPIWLETLAIISLLAGFGCAVTIAIDEFTHPQHMWIMNVVWPVFALFGSLPALWAYFVQGRARTAAWPCLVSCGRFRGI